MDLHHLVVGGGVQVGGERGAEGLDELGAAAGAHASSWSAASSRAAPIRPTAAPYPGTRAAAD